MLRSMLDVSEFQDKQNRGLHGWEIDAMNEAIWCVEQVHNRIPKKIGIKPSDHIPMAHIRNRLMVLMNFYSSIRYGYSKCFDAGDCEFLSECSRDLSECRLRGIADEYCGMLREAIRCVEIIYQNDPVSVLTL